MDDGIEMVEAYIEDDDSQGEGLALEEIELSRASSDYKLSPMQRTFLDTVSRFGLCSVALVFSIAVFALAAVSLVPEELFTSATAENSIHDSEIMKEATNKVKAIDSASTTGTYPEATPSNSGDIVVTEATTTTSTDGEENTASSDDLHEWIASKVTLNDGKKYEVVDQLVHDKTSFTEGLMFVDGRLFESAGLYGKSNLQELDPNTGETIQVIEVPKVFAEGLTYAPGRLIQLTYKAKKGFVYNFYNLTEPPSEFSFSTITGEGWGMTYMEETNELVVSDGSEYLLFWNADTFEETRRVKVTRQNGVSSRNINELEYWRGKILANVWFQDCILVIDPDSGDVEKEYDFHDLWLKSDRQKHGADVLNGISISADPDILYVTGKKWDRMFKIKLLV